MATRAVETKQCSVRTTCESFVCVLLVSMTLPRANSKGTKRTYYILSHVSVGSESLVQYGLRTSVRNSGCVVGNSVAGEALRKSFSREIVSALVNASKEEPISRQLFGARRRESVYCER